MFFSKKNFAIALTVVFTLSSFVVSFAAPEYTTVTTYESGDDVRVLTTVSSGVNQDDEVTYLVGASDITNSSDPAAKITYIDQRTYEGLPITFDFTTTSAKLNEKGGIIRVGSTSSAAVTSLLDLQSASVSASQFALQNKLDNSITLFCSVPNATENKVEFYGILFSTSDELATSELDIRTAFKDSIQNGNIYKFAALNKSSSDQFAIKIFDEGAGKLSIGTKFYYRPYIITTENDVILGDVQQNTLIDYQ